MAFGVHEESPLFNLFSSGGSGRGRTDLEFERYTADFGRHKTGWTIPEAYLGLLIATALADDHYHPEEQQEVLKLGRRSQILSDLSVQELAAANDAVNERFRTRGDRALREACETLPDEMRLAVFGHCIEMALADGELRKSETTLLENLVGLMRLEPRDAHRIFEVLITLARF